MICKKCNHEYPDSFDKCPVCGEPNPGLQEASSTQYIGPSDADGPSGNYSWGDPAKESQNSGSWGPAADSGSQETWQSPGQTGAGQYTRPMPPAVQQGERKSVTAPLVCGILSPVIPMIGLVLGIIAVVMGSSAKKYYLKDTAEYSMAQAGWILGIIGIVLQAILIIYVAVVFNLVLAGLANAFDYYSGYSYFDPSDLYPFGY